MSKGAALATRDENEALFRESFDRFYLREFTPMVALALAVSGSSSAAEDLAQEAMVRAHKNWDHVSGYDKPGAWVRRVTINLARSALRKRASETKALFRVAGSSGPVPEPDAADQSLWTAVKRLPKNQRAAVALFYLEDMTVRDIAEILECSESTAKVHLHRGRAALAAVLDREPEEKS